MDKYKEMSEARALLLVWWWGMDENVKTFCGRKGKRRQRRSPAKEETTALYRELISGENT